MVGARPVVDGPPTKERMGIKRRHVHSTLIGVTLVQGLQGYTVPYFLPMSTPPTRSGWQGRPRRLAGWQLRDLARVASLARAAGVTAL